MPGKCCNGSTIKSGELSVNSDKLKNAKASAKTNKDFKKCLVIGGAGMLGFEIAKQLYEDGKEVSILDLVPFNDKRFKGHIGDIRNRDDIKKACVGMGHSNGPDHIDVVFQTAAAVWDTKTPPEVYDEVNVQGNINVIDVCRELGIQKLVYSSTIDVVVDGRKPIVYGDESIPYPEKLPKDHYCRTKIIAEQIVTKANSPELLTCSLRPAGMYGPRDKYHLTNIIKAAMSRSNFRLGDGSAKFSHVYSENAAHAHVLAAKNLYEGSPVAGNIYFITDHQPAENLFDFMKPLLEGLSLKPPKKSIPYPFVYYMGWINEKINPRSVFNTFAIIQTCIDHTYTHDKATEDFGYEPIVSKEEAVKRTLEWFRQNWDSLFVSRPQ
jgi:nucleoside-diphosphate-sugar epimerase